jgi:uncharacterized protein (TIGR02231 family)
MITRSVDPLPARLRPPAAEAGFDHAFDAEAPVDVPSDGAPHSVPIVHGGATAAARFVVVPRESTDVFRVVELDNPLQGPLLDGPIDAYVGSDFLLTADVHATPPGGRVVLGLGVEQAVKVARNTTFREDTVGLMRGGLDLAHEISIEVVSHLRVPAVVEVRERIPVSREGDDEVKVSIGSVEPAWQPWEPREGALRGGFAWRVKIEPGAKRELTAKYVVRISSKDELVGGNRRER